MGISRSIGCRRLAVAATILALAALSSPQVHAAVYVYDYDDGTLQGWTEGKPPWNPQFLGSLRALEPGNPGHAMVATDHGATGGALLAQAPAVISGDLSSWPSVSWDEWLPDGSIIRTSVSVLGPDGTVYQGETPDQGVISTESWQERFIPFDFGSGLWSIRDGTGSASFDEVITNVVGFYIHMDVTPGQSTEASVDNVIFLPEPATVSLLALGGLVALRRRRGCRGS